MKLKIGFIASLTLAAYQPTMAGDTFEDGNVKTVHLDGVPTFDQLRRFDTAPYADYTEPILGLPMNGKFYCVPTSTTDWMSFLANRGYPNLSPGKGLNTGSWETGHAGLAEYNRVNITIQLIASNMQTDAAKGTGGGLAQLGSQQALDSSYSGQFCTVNLYADNSGYPRITDLIDSELNGNLITPYGGWYTDVIVKGQLAYYLDGGHATAMAEARFVSGPETATLGLCNPATGDKDTRQSPQLYSQFTTTPATVATVNRDDQNMVLPDTLKYVDVDFLDKNSKWILNGALQIQPFSGYTIHHNFITELNPNAFVNNHAFSGGFRRDFAKSERTVQYATRNPLTGLLYYQVVQDLPTLYCLRPLSGESKLIQTFYNQSPRALVFGAEFTPYALLGDGSVYKMDLNTGGLLDGIDLPMMIDRIVFDPIHRQLAAIDLSRGKYVMLDKDLNRVGPVQSFTLRKGYGQTFTEFGPKGHLYIFQTGDPYLAENIPTTNGRMVSIPHFLPAVQDAEGFSVDDWGRLFFSLRGTMQVVDGFGSPINSPFNGMPGGETIGLSHSLNNWDPKIHRRPSWYDRLPPRGFGATNVLRP